MQHLLTAMKNVTEATSLTELFRAINSDSKDFLMCNNTQIYIINPSLMHWFVHEEKGRVTNYHLFDKKLHIDETVFTPEVV